MTGRVHAFAPLRVSLAGGGSDVPPYPARFGGAVVSLTIDLGVRATVERGRHAGAVPMRPGPVDPAQPDRRLVDVVTRHAGVAAEVQASTRCDVPRGSGLGSSSAQIVALYAALLRVAGRSRTREQLAATACRVEGELGLAGGLQDAYAAAFGGANHIEFAGSAVHVRRLSLTAPVLETVEASLILAPTPRLSRRADDIVRRRIAACERGDERVLDALHRLKAQVHDMRACLTGGDVATMGELLHAGWQIKRTLGPGVSTPAIDRLYALGRDLGAAGGKLLGAGAGGYLLFVVRPQVRTELVAALRRRGVRTRGVRLVGQGVQTWEDP